MLGTILIGALIGIGGTAAMDVWSIVLWKVFGQGAPDWAPVGRWTWHLQGGTVFHRRIGDAAPYAHEQALGWFVHYAVGILYGVALALVMGAAWLAAPTFLPALVWGIVTVAAGWFLLQPGLVQVGVVDPVDDQPPLGPGRQQAKTQRRDHRLAIRAESGSRRCYRASNP